MAEFTGFAVAALDFYEDLENDNTKSFWQAHEGDYRRLVREPMHALASALEPEFGSAKVFRPYRDVRFSRDKTPYKDHQGAWVRTADGTGYYLQIDASGLMTGGGWYHAEADAKARFRTAVDEERRGLALQRLLSRLERAGFTVGGDRVKTRPRGWDADHPRIDLLRHNTLTVRRDHGGPDWLFGPDAALRIRDDWRALTPLLDWHRDHVAP